MENTTEIGDQVAKETALAEVRDELKKLGEQFIALIRKMETVAGHDYGRAKFAFAAALAWIEAHF